MSALNTVTLKLVVESELGFGDEYPISSDRSIIIGRGGASNIQLPQDNLTSREHCKIYYADSNFIIQDLSSSNGTQLNNQDIDIVKIKNDDVLGIGTTIFRAKIEVKSEVDSTPVKQDENVKKVRDSDSTMAVQNAAKIQTKQEFSLFIDTEDETSPLIDNSSSFKTDILLWQDIDGTNKLSVIAKNTFKMLPDQEAQLSDKSIPLFHQTYFYEDKDHGSILYESDLVPFKPLTDIVVVGKAHTPNKQPQPTLDAGLQVGNTKKVIKVFGDREWYQAEEEGDFVISEPIPFTTMDLKYEKSFGGSDLDNGVYFQPNPIGCGCIVEESLQNKQLCKLPNIESPQDLLESWKSRPNTVGLGFYANNWEPRIQYLGSYDDEELLEENRLGLPKNFSHRFYNSAHPDLQVEAYLKGDEKVELVNLSSKGRLVFHLPDVKPTVVVRKKELNVEATETSKVNESQVIMNLDTLVFIPEEDVFYQVFRGVFKLNSLEDMQNISIRVK